MDYAIAQNAEGNWLSNFEEPFPVGQLRVRQMAWWRSPAMPASSLVIGNLPMDEEHFGFSLKSLIGTLPIVLGDPRKIPVDNRKVIRDWALWMKEMQSKYNYMSFRKDLPGFGEPKEGNWDGWMRINTELKTGGIIGVFRQGALEDRRTIFLTDLEPDRNYVIRSAPYGHQIATGKGSQFMVKGFEAIITKKYDGNLYEVSMSRELNYFPPSETEGGWRSALPETLGVDTAMLKDAVTWHNTHEYTSKLGGALMIVYKGFVIAEYYTTGTEGGPQPWTPYICNDIKSSTKSVFGTASGVFLDEYKDLVNLESLLIGTSRETSLIPQIWDQPITDIAKTRIKIKHALSMTSGHTNAETWFAPGIRQHTPGYTGPFQMYEYCFGWWAFENAGFKVDSHVKLKFEPGTNFLYSNFGLELVSLAIKNISGELMGTYLYDRVLGPIGLPVELRDNQVKELTYIASKPMKFLWDGEFLNYSLHPGWGVGGAQGCNAYGADGSDSPLGPNHIAGNTLRISLRDYARIAYLWLQKGNWNDKQLVSEEWMELATKKHVREDGTSPVGYGYTFWVHDNWEGVPQDAFMSHGDRLNDAFVIPSLDLVVVRQGNWNPPDRELMRKELIQRITKAIMNSDR